MKETEKGIAVSILKESYAPDVLRVLWERFTVERVEQHSRLELTIPPDYPLDELRGVVVADPAQRLLDQLSDALKRILPEGFRVWRTIPDGGRFLVLASENPILDSHLERVRERLNKPPKPIPLERLAAVLMTPKEDKTRRQRPWRLEHGEEEGGEEKDHV